MYELEFTDSMEHGAMKQILSEQIYKYIPQLYRETSSELTR